MDINLLCLYVDNNYCRLHGLKNLNLNFGLTWLQEKAQFPGIPKVVFIEFLLYTYLNFAVVGKLLDKDFKKKQFQFSAYLQGQ